MFGALKPGFRSLANVVGELKAEKTAALSRGFLATARLSCLMTDGVVTVLIMFSVQFLSVRHYPLRQSEHIYTVLAVITHRPDGVP